MSKSRRKKKTEKYFHTHDGAAAGLEGEQALGRKRADKREIASAVGAGIARIRSIARPLFRAVAYASVLVNGLREVIGKMRGGRAHAAE